MAKSDSRRTIGHRLAQLPDGVVTALRAAFDKKAQQVTVMDLRPAHAFTDAFIICAGQTPRQVKAIAEAIEAALKKEEERPAHVEGLERADWVLLDYFDFVVHVFTPDTRTFYGLERLWGSAEVLEVVEADLPYIGNVRAAVRATVDALLAIVWAARCAACRRPLHSPTRGPVCDACWSAIVPCASRDRPTSTSISAARAAGLYEGSLREIVHAFKYQGHQTLAAPLARLMRHAAADILIDADVVVAVPLHPRRAWSRGFNQAADLADLLPPRRVTALRRTRFEAAQAGLGRAARVGNVLGVFAPSRRLRLTSWLASSGAASWVPGRTVRWMERRWSVRGKIVVMVDDVRTTGATLDACAGVLLACGAREVRAVTAALVDSR